MFKKMFVNSRRAVCTICINKKQAVLRGKTELYHKPSDKPSEIKKEETGMSRKGENIYLRKDGRWEGRYIKGRREDGRAVMGSVYGKKYSDVKRQLTLVKAGLYGEGSVRRIFEKGTFRDWAEYWLEVLAKPRVRPGTYAGYCRNVRNHMYPFIGEMQLADITGRHIQDMVSELQGKLASGTLRGICRLLKAILDAACARKYIDCNPYHGIRIPGMEKQAPRILTRSEQKKVEQTAMAEEKEEYIICLYTGLRVGELCALKWSDVDLDNRVLHVRNSVQRIPAGYLSGRMGELTGKDEFSEAGGERSAVGDEHSEKTALVIGRPKSASSVREIPVSDHLAEILETKRVREQGLGSEYLFPGTKKKFRDPRSMQIGISSMCRKMGIEGVHMHTLRHTFATRCLEKNVNYQVLSEFLGHSSPGITMEHYSHCTFESKRENIARLEPDNSEAE